MKQPLLRKNTSFFFSTLISISKKLFSRLSEINSASNTISISGNSTNRNVKIIGYRLLRVIPILLLPVFSFAQPTYVGSSSTPTTDGGTQAGPTVAVAPVGGVQAGDLIVIYAQYRATGATFSMSQASNQIWSTGPSLNTTANQSFAIFWCRFNGSWGANPSVTIGAGTNGMSVIMYAYRPTNSGKAWTINTTTAAATSTSSATVSITGHTTTIGNTVTMAFWGSPAATTWNTAPLLTGGWTKPGLTQYRNATTGQSHSAAYKISTIAGATGNVAQTQSAAQQTKTCLISWGEIDVSDVCSSAISLTPGTTCVTILGTLTGATYAAGGGVPGCGAANLDVWYKFTAQSANTVITTTKTYGSGQRRTELYEGACGALVSKACSGDNNNLTATGLVFGQTYYVRVYSEDANPYEFTICVDDNAAANGACAGAVTLTPAVSCTPVSGDLFLADSTSYTLTGTTSPSCGNNTYDMWYRFTAPPNYAYATITVTPTGSPSALTTSNTFIETFKNNCTLTNNSTGCSNIATPRNIAIEDGTVYYFRVYTTAQSNVYGSSFQFNICITLSDGIVSSGSRMREVFKQTILSPPDPSPNVLNNPWEITYGPDNKLWVTESKGYKVYTIDPVSGLKTMVLDITQGSTFLGPDTANIRSRSNNGANSQGGLAGLALHPNFMDGTANEKNYVYISYVFVQDSTSVFNGSCRFFKNKIVRFTYDEGTGLLGSPVRICDTIPGGDDHNSQRMIIAPVVKGGPKYLFYAAGDLGGGQLNCRLRWQKAQHVNSYEGKILRFNLETSATDPMTATDPTWIPDDNPFNILLGVESAVWSTGIRNNQGFAYDTALNILYGSSHGPYSDDEINIIQRKKNYGHPYVIGYSTDGNYDGDTTIANQRFSAGSPFTSGGGVSMCPPVGSEMGQKALINADSVTRGEYKDPLFSAYPGPATGPGSVDSIWRNNPGNALPAPGWPSEAWSGLDLYTNSKIPGWKKSLIASSLKWGRLLRLKLVPTGDTTWPSRQAVNNASDTISYFGSQNRFRDIAFDPNGRDIYIIMDKSTTTSGPSAQWPVVPACQGCVQKYTFLGYYVNAGDNDKSYIPTSIAIAPGKNNVCDSVNSVTIDDDNKNLWVPLTDTASNIVAEIYAMGENLGRITAKVYHNSTGVRSRNGRKYLDRNITITPEFQPTGDVKIRLYITKDEYEDLRDAAGSGIDDPGDVKIVKNNDACGSSMSANPNAVTMDFDAEAFGTDAYVLQGTIDGFSTFYFGSNNITTLPLDLITFSGLLQSDNTVLLKWKTENEINTSHFEVQRSVDGRHFTNIGNVTARNLASDNYFHNDVEAANQQSTILYYRLKIMDNDGSYKYSNIITISLNTVTSIVKVSPNPTRGIVTVSCMSSINDKAKWQLIDNSGRVVLQNTTQLKTGNNNWTIDISGVTAGTYYLTIKGAGLDQKIKVQKL